MDSYFYIIEIFHRLGWDLILSLPDYYFPHLVREFYANMDHKDGYNGWYLGTHVGGHEIRITRDRLTTVLGYHDDGLDVDSMLKFHWNGDW